MEGAIEDEQARQFAEAQVEVERARSAIAVVTGQVFGHSAEEEQPTASARRRQSGHAAPTLNSLKNLDRYLRRAFSRRDRWIRSFAGPSDDKDLG